MDGEPDTLATAPDVRIDDLVKSDPRLSRWRPVVGICPKLSDAKLVTVAVVQSLLGSTSERRFLRFARASRRRLLLPPDRAGYNERLRLAAARMKVLVFLLARETDLFCDDVFVDSTPVECGRSRPTADEREVLRDLLEIDPALCGQAPRSRSRCAG